MQNKEPERADPSGYAFGVKCSATLERKATQWRNIPIHWNVAVAEATWFPKGKPTFLHEKTRLDGERIFGIGITW
jgi:hypothetical protein